MRSSRLLFLIPILLALPLRARAQEGPPLGPSPTDIQGAKSLAMGGAFRADGATNDAIYFNPAALGQTQRYALQLQGMHDLNENEDQIGASIADSAAGPVAGGLSFNRIIIGPSGSRLGLDEFHLALATNISDAVWVGATGKLLHYADATGTHNRATPDVGAFIKAAPVNLGLVAYNLVDIATPLAPRQYAAAINLTLGHGIVVEGDVVFDTSTNPDVSLAYHAGAEWEVIPVLALRAGYVEDRILNQRSVAGGIGIAVPPGFGLDIAYREELLGTKSGRDMSMSLDLAF